MNHKCKCGNYKSYSQELGTHEVAAPMMPLDACVNCMPKFDEIKFKEFINNFHKINGGKK
jgi:hypothetical protein